MSDTYVKLDSVTVGSGGAASVTFSNISQNYTDLIIKVSARTDRAAIHDWLTMRINGSTTNYSDYALYADWTTAQTNYNLGGANSIMYLGFINGASGTASTFSNMDITIPNYTTQSNKTIFHKSAIENNTDGGSSQKFVSVGSGYSYNYVDSINTIRLAAIGSFVQHSTFTLYGILNKDVSAVPSAPTIGTATAGNLSASVAFTTVSNAASYTITSSPGNITATNTTSPIRITGLTAGTSYTFTCTANNAYGSSSASSASNSITPTTAGATWTVQSGVMPAATGWEDVAYANGMFLTAPTDVIGKVAVSFDGLTWTYVSTSTTGSPYWSGVAYGAGVWAISNRAGSGTGYNHMWSADNGLTWTYGSGGSNAYLPKLCWNGAAFFVGGQGFNYGDRSTDGKTWSVITLPSSQGWGMIAGRSGYFILGQDGGASPTNVVATSSDNGSTWTQRTITSTAQRWQAAAYNTAGTKCVAVARSNNAGAYTTDDGVTWTASTLTSGTWVDITYGDGYWIAIGWSNCCTSSDGITWTARTIPSGTSGGGEGITYGPKGALVVQYGSSNIATAF